MNELRVEIRERELDFNDYERMETRAIREFIEYTNEDMIRDIFSDHGGSLPQSLYNVREVLIMNGVEGIPFKSYRKDNDPGRLEL